MNSNKRFNLRLGLGALAVSAVLPASLFGNCGADLSTQFQVQLGRQVMNNGVIQQTADITNLGATHKGPFFLEVYNLPAGVTESPYTWTSSCEPGAQFIRIYLGYDNTWINGTSKTLMLTFYGSSSSSIVYNYRVLDGSVLSNPRVVPGDYDGDRIADIATYNITTGFWTIKQSHNNMVTSKQYGTPNTDHFVVGDFDGDLKEDLAIYRPSGGLWFFTRSSDGVPMGFQFGVPNVDIPVPADYDGDGYTDLAVYNPTTATFTVRQSSNGQTITKLFGWPGDIPVPAQYDPDGKADFAVFHPANFTFYILQSQTNQLFTLAAPGFQNGKPFAADFNGDGLADMAAYNPNTGKVTIVYMALGNQAMGTLTQNMAGKAMPVAADFSGDFQADMATYTMSTAHWALDSQMNNPNLHPVLSFAFGTPPSDVPVMTIPSVLW